MAGLSLRRMRLNTAVRELAREVRPDADQFVQPLFVAEGLRKREAVPGLNYVWRDTTDSLLQQIESDLAVGINKFLLFGVPSTKAERSFNHDFTAAPIAAVKQRFDTAAWLRMSACVRQRHTATAGCWQIPATVWLMRQA